MESFFQQGQNQQLVVAFHGTGGNEYQLLSTTAALFPDASVLSYLGDEDSGPQRRFFAQLVDGAIDRGDFDQKVKQFLAIWSNVAVAQYQEIIFLGYSNGANFILGLLEKNPQLATTVILLHPSNLDYQFAETSAAKVILTTGAQDNLSLPGAIVQLKNQLAPYFSAVDLVITDGGHQLTEQEIEQIKEHL